MERRIVIMAGGTGGHVFPALAVALLLRERGWQVSWLGTRQGLEGRIVPQYALPLDALDVVGWRGKSRAEQCIAVWRLLKALTQAVRYLRQRRPHVVLGMGGFAAAPGGLIARVFGIPLLIHEQNRIPGTTNRWLAHIATRVLEGFPESFAPTVGAICTGNPLRRDLVARATLPRPAYDASRPLRVLVVGGSLGAKVLNEIVPIALQRWVRTYSPTESPSPNEFGPTMEGPVGANLFAHTAPDRPHEFGPTMEEDKCDATPPLPQALEILHQTGEALRDEVTTTYTRLGLRADVRAFIDDMAEAYYWADVAVCRAGAMTVSELAAIGLPAVLIPFPYAIDDHQTANARYLAEQGAAVLLPQRELTPETLVQALQRVIRDHATMRQQLRRLARLDATFAIATWCEQEAKR